MLPPDARAARIPQLAASSNRPLPGPDQALAECRRPGDLRARKSALAGPLATKGRRALPRSRLHLTAASERSPSDSADGGWGMSAVAACAIQAASSRRVLLSPLCES